MARLDFATKPLDDSHRVTRRPNSAHHHSSKGRALYRTELARQVSTLPHPSPDAPQHVRLIYPVQPSNLDSRPASCAFNGTKFGFIVAIESERGQKSGRIT